MKFFIRKTKKSSMDDQKRNKEINGKKIYGEVESNEMEERLRALANQLELLREEERHRISREIHDDLGQILTALKIDLVELRNKPAEKIELASKLQPIIELVDSGIESARRISFELRPGILDQMGLVPALEWLLAEFQRRTKIDCIVDFSDHLEALDTDKAVAIYRIFQEITTNIARHSQATQVTISFQISPKTILLVVKDNGKGFDYKNKNESLGLLGMQERAKIHGGNLYIVSELGKGTTISLRIPNKKEDND